MEINIMEQQYKEKEISFINEDNKVFGTLTLPTKKKVDSAIILLHSCERSHRDEDFFKEISHFLATEGIAVYRYDSPGAGESEGKAFMQSFKDRKVEAVQAFKAVQEFLTFDSEQIGFCGLSEGSIIAFMASKELKSCKCVIPISAEFDSYSVKRLLSDIEADVRDC